MRLLGLLGLSGLRGVKVLPEKFDLLDREKAAGLPGHCVEWFPKPFKSEFK
ncbi:hypothetical protein [Infirmifilum sp.]|uniref:hypothetical protein n=1 Tax=Infirmifilum sp. TaxID=2856575 RepID=UPI003D0F905C